MNDIANEFVNYFQYIFTSSSYNTVRYIPNMNVQNQVDDFTNSVSDKSEILEIFKTIRRNASPGPDGFNVAFYISAWPWIGDDVTKVVTSFYTSGILPTHLNDTQIGLIPKKTSLSPSF
jgi:hypothetical protein